jgi:hypothetical protein
MELERLQELSVFYFIHDLFTANPEINIVDSFPMAELVIPTIAVDSDVEDFLPFELGNRKRLRIRVWNIDIFAKSKTQRTDIASIILDALEDTPISVYDYNEGFPPTTPTKLGCLILKDLRFKPIKVFPELVDTLYWRGNISVSFKYSIV